MKLFFMVRLIKKYHKEKNTIKEIWIFCNKKIKIIKKKF